MSPASDSSVNVESLSDALRLDADTGIWRTQVAADGHISYPADHNATCFQLEDGSFWFAHRNRCIIAAVRRFPPDGFILDIGGGNGFVAQGLIEAGYETALLEPGSDGAQNARHGRRLPTVINASIGDAAIRAGSVPNAGLFDVLEHIEDDRAFMRQLRDIMRPGGLLYLTVPAFNWLWSVSDVDAMHYRRYTTRSLTDVLAGGFDVLYSTYLFQRLVPLTMVMRALPYRVGLAKPKPAHEYEREHAVGRQGVAEMFGKMLGHEVAAIAAGKSLMRWLQPARRCPAGSRMNDRRYVAYHWAIILATPFFLLALNQNLFINPLTNQWIDPWLYTGFFWSLPDFLERWGDTYYATRLSWLLPGFAVHRLFSPLVANYVLHIVFFYVLLFSVYSLVTSGINRTTAFVVTMLVAWEPELISAMSWDYVDGAVITYFVVTLMCLEKASSSTHTWPWALASGAGLTCLASANLVATTLWPVCALFLLLRVGVARWRTILDCRRGGDWGSRHVCGPGLGQSTTGRAVPLLQGVAELCQHQSLASQPVGCEGLSLASGRACVAIAGRRRDRRRPRARGPSADRQVLRRCGSSMCAGGRRVVCDPFDDVEPQPPHLGTTARI